MYSCNLENNAVVDIKRIAIFSRVVEKMELKALF
jgi:hypothetical protein